MQEEIKINGNPDESCVIVKGGYDKFIAYIKGRIYALGLDIEDQGFVLYGINEAEQHYISHKGRHYFKSLIDYITSEPVYVMKVVGKNARFKIDANKKSIREAVLSNYPNLSDEDRKTRNVIHATDLVTDSQYEWNIAQSLLENNNDLNV